MYSDLAKYVKQEQYRFNGYNDDATLMFYKNYAKQFYARVTAEEGKVGKESKESLNNIYRRYLVSTQTTDEDFATAAFLMILKLDTIPKVYQKLGIDEEVASVAYTYKRTYKLHERKPQSKQKKGYPRTINGAPAPSCDCRKFLDHCYIIYANGQVYSRKSNGFLRGKWDPSKGQLFHFKGDRDTHDYFYSAAELVAAAFIDNPNGYKLVGFKDGNNANANLNNLYYKNVRDDKEHKPVPFEFYE